MFSMTCTVVDYSFSGVIDKHSEVVSDSSFCALGN